jgi:K+-transporting ATPase ATPase C chain
MRDIRASFALLVFFTLVTGIIYPLVMLTAGEALFPVQASGSLIQQDGKIIGSMLIGQNFVTDKYFHPRPSAAGNGYDASNSSGSNLAPTSVDLAKTYAARVKDLRVDDNTKPIPVDMVTASGSGLDPDISVASAKFQAGRVADTRGFTVVEIEKIVADHTIHPLFGLMGEKRVNVLELNRALDAQQPATP